MSLALQDLSRHGIVLLPPSHAEFAKHLTDIEERLQTRPQMIQLFSSNELRSAAILLNQSSRAIVSLSYLWLIKNANGQPVSHRSFGSASLLLPFHSDQKARRFTLYWNAILPGSKRLMLPNGASIGDNTDVRPPAQDEIKRDGEGYIQWDSEGGELIDPALSQAIGLTVDSVCFEDGGFAGPDELGGWEYLIQEVKVRLECAALAAAKTPQSAFAEIEHRAGARDAPPARFGSRCPGEFRQAIYRDIAQRISMTREQRGAAETLASIRQWADNTPILHRL